MTKCAGRHIMMGCVRSVSGRDIAGFGTGETPDQMIESLQMAIGELPPPLLRLAQGISYPSAVVAAVGAGIDLFDAGLASSASSAALALAFDIRLPATMPEGIPNVARSSPVVDLKDTR
jgi:tRNA-guanine family transglycosylase